MFGSEKIVYEGDTPHDHYVVVDRTYEGRQARVLFSGRAHSAQSGLALDDGPDLLFDYNQRLLELASGLYPKTILVIGGGAFTLPMALIRALPTTHVDVIEIDAGLRQIATDYFGLQSSEQLAIITTDGRQYLQTTSKHYDLIIIDAYAHLTIPASLVSQQAVQLMHDHLTADGVVAINIIATYLGRNADAIRSHIATYQSVFKQVDVFPAAYGLTSWLPQNLILIAQTGQPRIWDEYLRYAPLQPLAVDVDEAFVDNPE